MEDLHNIGSLISRTAGGQGTGPDQEREATQDVLQFQAALAIDLDSCRRKDQREDYAHERVSVELGDHASEAEGVSYRLFDDGRLNYTDRLCTGTYDVWGNFVTKEGAPAAKFPSLAELASIPYEEGDTREVIVVDHQNDSQLRRIARAAARVLAEHARNGALACVQALARLVSEHLGGSSSHAELSERYREAVKGVKSARRSLVIPIGELSVGVSRHRSLLLKALLDECSFACCILRGSLYLGAAGASGENSVALVQIHDEEYMVELVTEPGRTIPLQRESVPLPTSAAAWGLPVNSKLSPTGGASIPAEQIPQVAADPTPGAGQGAPGQAQQIGDSITGPSTIAHSAKSERTPRKVTGGASDTDASSESQAGLRWGDGEELTQTALESLAEGNSEGPSTSGGTSADVSVQSLAAVRDLQEGPQLLQFPSMDECVVPGERKTLSEDSARPSMDVPVSGQASVPLSEPVALADVALQRRLSLLETFRTGSGPRARVRGKDASGQMVEMDLEVEGLTMTHQGAGGRRSLESLMPRPPPLHTDTLQLRSMEPLVRRSQFWGPDPKLAGSHTTAGSTSSAEDNQWNVTSLALDRKPGAHTTSHRSSAETVHSDARSSGENMQVGHGPLQPQEGRTVRTSSGMLGALSTAPSMRSDRSLSPTSAQQAAHSLLSNPGLFRAREGSATSQKDESMGASTTTNSKSGSSTQKSNMSWDGSKESSAPSTSEQTTATGITFSKARDGTLVATPQGTTRSHSAGPTFYDAKGLAASMQDLNFRQKQQLSDHGSDGDKSMEDSTPALDIPEVDDAEIDFASLDLGPRIGMGCFGEVFKAHWRQTTVAVKKFLEQSLSDQTLREFKAEVLMNRRLRHPNIIAFLGACTEKPNLCIVTAWAPRGSLFHLLHNSGPVNLTLRQKLRMALDTARGMHYLHSAKPPIIHRDLKSMNLLVDNDLTIKVCDFGLARVRSGTWMTGKSQGGTPEWTAPEVLRSQSWNEKSDVYSYGVILFELVSGEKPWADMSPMQVVGAVGWGHARLEVPRNSPPFFASLMERCWGEHTQRPSFDEIIRELIQHANKDRPKSSKASELAASTPGTSQPSSSNPAISDTPSSGTSHPSSSTPGLSDNPSTSTSGASEPASSSAHAGLEKPSS